MAVSFADLIKDPLETNNLVRDPAHAAVFRDLSEQLTAWQRDNPPVPVMEGVSPEPAGRAVPAGVQTRQRGRRRRRRRE